MQQKKPDRRRIPRKWGRIEIMGKGGGEGGGVDREEHEREGGWMGS